MESKKRKMRIIKSDEEQEKSLEKKSSSKIVKNHILKDYDGKESRKEEIDENCNKLIRSSSRTKRQNSDSVELGWESPKSNENSLLVKNFNSNPSSKILGLDLDDTLIHTKSGAKFAQNKNDWKLIYDKNIIKSKLQEYIDKGYRIVIFTNQSGISKGKTNPNDWKYKIENLVKELELPFVVIAALKSDFNRKPAIGMWKYLEEFLTDSHTLDKENSIYVGDAAGRDKNSQGKKDHSDSDYKYALNLGINFFTPEEFFKNIKIKLPNKFDFDPKDFRKVQADIQKFLKIDPKNQEMIILVGSPASGKSSITHNYLIPKGYIHVNNDTLKTAVKCQKLTEESLSLGKSVVIDNTNPGKVIRKIYIDLANKFNVPVRCFFFNYPKNLIFHLNNLRDINKVKKIYSNSVPDVVIHTWYKNLEKPSLAEGFKDIIEIPFIPGPFKNSEDEEIFYMHSAS